MKRAVSRAVIWAISSSWMGKMFGGKINWFIFFTYQGLSCTPLFFTNTFIFLHYWMNVLLFFCDSPPSLTFTSRWMTPKSWRKPVTNQQRRTDKTQENCLTDVGRPLRTHHILIRPLFYNYFRLSTFSSGHNSDLIGIFSREGVQVYNMYVG